MAAEFSDEGAEDVQGRADEPLHPDRITLRSVLIVLCSTLATATYAFTWNSVTVALAHMQGTFSATTDQIAWIMIAFVIGSAVTTASIGWFSVRFGRRTLFLFCIAGFSVTLVGCGYSTVLEEAVTWRFFQGLFGAGLIPLGQAIAVNAFPADRHGQATSLWALGFVSANVIAPTVAGHLVEDFGWSWVFFFSLPVALMTFAAAWFLVPASPKTKRPMDWFGFTTLIVGVGVLQLMLAKGEREDWFQSNEIVIEALIAGLALYLFFAHSFTARRTFIDFGLFRDRNFALGQLFIFLIGLVLFLPLFLIPILLQQIAGYPPVETGNLMLARGVGSIASLIIMSRIRDSIDPRPIFAVGLALSAYAAFLMSGWTVDVKPNDVVLANLIQGLATGAVWAPINTLTLSRLPGRKQDQGFALFYLNFDLGSAIGTAGIVALLARHSQANHAALAEMSSPYSEWLRTPSAVSYWSITEVEGLAALNEEIARQAAMIAYNNAFLAIAVLLAALIPFILLFHYRKRKPASQSL